MITPLMRTIFLAAVLFAVACGGSSPPCLAGEGLNTWSLKGPVEVDPTCPSRGTIHLADDNEVVYILKNIPGPLSVEAFFDLACDPADGNLDLGISEAGSRVTLSKGQLASQTLRAATAKAGIFGITIGGQAQRACDVGLRVVVAGN